mgnify:CR=1 FL=1
MRGWTMSSFIVRELKEVLFLYQVNAESEGAAVTMVENGQVAPFGEDHTATIWTKVESDDE